MDPESCDKWIARDWGRSYGPHPTSVSISNRLPSIRKK